MLDLEGVNKRKYTPRDCWLLTSRRKDTGVAFVIAVSECLQEPIDLLRLFWQFHFHQELADAHVDRVTKV